MPIFFSIGYLIAVAATCSVWVYAIVKDVQLFAKVNDTPLTIAALVTEGTASLLGLALFLKLIHRGRAAYLGVLLYAVSSIAWLIVATTICTRREVASLGMILATFCGMLVFLATIRRGPEGKLVVPASGILAISLFAQPLLPFVGLIVCCGILVYSIVRSGETRGSLSDLLIVVALVAAALGVPAGRRAIHPLYTSQAVIVPLDEWSGPLAVSLTNFDVWVEYPKAALSPQQVAWFDRRHEDEQFYQRLGIDLRPTVVVKGCPEKPLRQPLILVSDTHDWVGECLDSVSTWTGQSTVYLNREAAADLGRLGARLVIDAPHLRRIKPDSRP